MFTNLTNIIRVIRGQIRGYSRAFTLVEMLVVMAIIAVISASLILYSRTGERQIILFKDQALIVAALSRAKSLSVATFGQAGVPCGYGVHFETPRKFLIFKDLVSDCNASDNIYSGGNELFESFELNQSLNFGNLTLTDVIFIPPNPKVVITPIQDEAVINIRTADGTSSLNVKVTSAGQISTQ